jgi:mannose-6-phosphate isomerase-like protein (cupin superfamily)
MHFKNTTILNKLIKIESKWEDFINLINESISFNVKNKKKYKNFSRIGLIRFYDKLTMVVDNVEKSRHLQIDSKKIKNYLFENKMESNYEIAIISFTNTENTTGKHFDNDDVFYVQFIGSVLWKVWEKEKENIYYLNPGDCIFVPKKTYHEVKSITPRAAVSFILK